MLANSKKPQRLRDAWHEAWPEHPVTQACSARSRGTGLTDASSASHCSSGVLGSECSVSLWMEPWGEAEGPQATVCGLHIHELTAGGGEHDGI